MTALDLIDRVLPQKARTPLAVCTAVVLGAIAGDRVKTAIRSTAEAAGRDGAHIEIAEVLTPEFQRALTAAATAAAAAAVQPVSTALATFQGEDKEWRRQTESRVQACCPYVRR